MEAVAVSYVFLYDIVINNVTKSRLYCKFHCLRYIIRVCRSSSFLALIITLAVFSDRVTASVCGYNCKPKETSLESACKRQYTKKSNNAINTP